MAIPNWGGALPAPQARWRWEECTEFSTGETFTYSRNEDGVRTSLSRRAIMSDSSRVKIGESGDSQTDLCAPNEQLPAAVLEGDLDGRGVPATAMTFGAGRYSPLQAYLAFRKVVRPYHPQVLILNVYTGNDLYDILRADDRPHFESTDSGYRIADPVWYTLDDPQVHYKSRVLFALRKLGDKVGIRQQILRVKELRRLGNQHGAGLFTTLAYMRDLWRARNPSVGYSDAFTAQMLNQQLFFYHFPGSLEESLRRTRALMGLIRQENPGMILVMSPLPSYELVGEQPVDEALRRTLSRLPVTYEDGQRQERGLYEELRELATEDHWVFVDNLAALQAYHGSERLYNSFDYHLLPVASALVGHAQAEALLPFLERGNPPSGSAKPMVSLKR